MGSRQEGARLITLEGPLPSPQAGAAPAGRGRTSAVPPPPRRPPVTASLRTAPRWITSGPATVTVRPKCSGRAALGRRPETPAGVPALPPLALPDCHVGTLAKHGWARLAASPAGRYQARLEGLHAPRGAGARPGTTDCASFGSESGGGGGARTGRIRQLVHAPLEALPTCALRVDHIRARQHALDRRTNTWDTTRHVRRGRLGPFPRGPGCHPKSSHFGVGAPHMSLQLASTAS